METGQRFSLRKFFFGKISRKWAIGFILLVILVFSSILVLITSAKQDMQKEIADNSVVLMKSIIDSVDRDIYQKAEDFRLYATRPLVKDELINSNKEFESRGNIQQYLNAKDKEWTSAPKEKITPFMANILGTMRSKEIIERLDYYENIYGFRVFGEAFVTNKYGAVVISSGKTTDYNQADEEWWQIAKEKGIYFSDSTYDESTGMHSIDIALSINDYNGNFRGVLTAVLNIRNIEEIVKEATLLSNTETPISEIQMINTQKEIIYSSKDSKDYREFLGNRDISEILERKEGYFIMPAMEGKPEYLVVHVHSDGYKDFSGNSWMLLGKYDTSVLFSPIDALINQFFIVFGFIIALMLFASFVVSATISKPIEKLAKSAGKLEKGDFKGAITNINSGDEVEELGRAINKAADALANVEEERKGIDKAKTEFLSITSHELRSPMTPMKAQLQMVLQGYFGRINKQQQEALDTVLRNTERLDKIIQDFLEVSRIEAARLKFEFKKINLASPIKSVIDEMKNVAAERKIRIKLQIGKLPDFEVDPDRVMQVLRNLLTNSIKFSNDKGEIEVTAGLKGSSILFSVKDNGIGISKENHYRIFEPFFQEEKTMYRKYGGTGLGLAICKGIIESQNGKIWFESEKNKGTTFYFTVPLKPVKEMKPIRLLFSTSAETERRLEKLFLEYLGPLGKSEMEILKNKGLTYKNMMAYAKNLRQKKVLDEKRYNDFRKELEDIFELETIDTTKLEQMAAETRTEVDYGSALQKMVLVAYKIYGNAALAKANSTGFVKTDSRGKIISVTGSDKEAFAKLASAYNEMLGDMSRFIKDEELKKALSGMR